MYDSCVRGDGQKPQLEYFRLFDFFFKLSGRFINFLDVEVFFFSSHLLLFSCPLSHPRPPSSLNSQDQTVQVQESFIPPPPSVFLPSAFLLSLLPPPPSSSCQLPLPSLFPPFLWWRMEKHSSINSPDNCPAALLLPALGHSVHLHRFTSSLLNLFFFFNSFFTQSLLIPQLFLYQKRKQKKSNFFSLSVGMVARPNILVNVGFSENVNGTQSQIQLQRERVELSSFFFFLPDVILASASHRLCQRTGGRKYFRFVFHLSGAGAEIKTKINPLLLLH